MSQQVKERSTVGYRQLAVNYIKQLDKVDPQKVFNAASAAGIQPEWDASKKVVVLHFPNGSSYSWRQALELNLISIQAVSNMPCDPISMTFGTLALGAVGTVYG